MNLETTLATLQAIEILRRLDELGLTYSFKHALMQDKAYQSLLIRTRREVHRRVAEAYEQLYADRLDEFAALLAHHYAQVGDDAKTFEYAIQAGDRAIRLYAYAEARTHLAHALDALAHLPDSIVNRRARVDTLIKHVSVSYANESSAQILEHLFQAESLIQALIETAPATAEDRLRLARVNYWIGRIYVYDNDLHRAMDYLMRVLAEARDFDDEELLTFPSAVIGRMMIVQGQFGAASVLLKQAIAPLEKTESWEEWISTMGNLGIAHAARGEYGTGIELGERAVARALETRNSIGASEAYICLGLIHFMGGDMPKMRQAANSCIQTAQKSKSQIYLHPALMEHALASSRLGDHTSAAETMAQARALDQQLPEGRAFTDWYAAAEAEIALNAGRIAEAIALAEHAVTCAQTLGGIYAQGLAQRVWGIALARQDAWGQAEAHFAASLLALETGEAQIEFARTLVARGNVFRARGDQNAAREQYARAAAQFQAAGLDEEFARTRRLLDEISRRT